MMALLDDEGLTSVVATNCGQRYERPLVLGDRVLVQSVIESITEPKRTGLGTGRFLTTRLDFVAVPDASVPDGELSDADVQALYEAGEPVASMTFRILKYLPPAKKPVRPPRPHPALTQDNAFWFEGAQAHRLLIQHCTSCGTLRHPPLPACGVCGSLDWDVVESSGKGHPVLLRGGALSAGAFVRVPACPSGWWNSRRGRGWWPTWTGWRSRTLRSGWRCRRSSWTSTRTCRYRCSCRCGRWGVRTGRRRKLMDFALSQEQLAVSEAAEGVFAGEPGRSGAHRHGRVLRGSLRS